MPKPPKSYPTRPAHSTYAGIVVSDDLSPQAWQRLWHRLYPVRRFVHWMTRSTVNMSIVIICVGLTIYVVKPKLERLFLPMSFQDGSSTNSASTASAPAPDSAGPAGSSVGTTQTGENPNAASAANPTSNTGADSTVTPTPASTNTTVTNSVNVESYGAAGNGFTDDTAALNTAFSRAPAGSTLVLSAGKTYKHTGLLKVRVAGLHITGSGTLLATNELDSALQINANNVTVDGGLYFRFNTAGIARQNAGWETMIFVQGCSGTHLSNITIDGSPSAGILFLDASNYTVDTVLVENTLADSIHSTNGSYNGLIENSTSINSGDDGFANVSYTSNAVQVHDITYENDTVRNQLWGRGFSVVGGHDITFNNIHVDGTSSSAAIYVASEANFKTYGVANVHVHGATINHANANNAVVLIADSQPAYSITDVDMSDVVITNVSAGVPQVVGIQAHAGTGILRIGLYRFTITGPQLPFALSGTSPASYSTVGWTVNNAHVADHIGF
jgi:hypothetical protein